MVHFIYGRAGSGKSTEMLKYISEDIKNGVPSFLIVPEQESVAAEKKLLSIFPPYAQLSVEVLNFSRLCNRIFRTWGGLSYNFATNGIRSLLMWNTLRELSPLLAEYGHSDASDSAMTQKMLSAVKELKAYSVSPAELEKALDLIAEDTHLYSKIKDISLIYAAYSARLENTFSDTYDDLPKAHKILSKHNFFEGADVYIDSFTGFTKQELDIISDIFKLARNVYISVCLPSPDCDEIHFETIRDNVISLKKLLFGKEYREIILENNRRQESKEISYLEKNLWRFDAPPYISDTDKHTIFPYICDNPYSEAEIAASRISEEVRNGARYGEIAVIARDAEKYRGIIDSVFEKYNIPFYMSEKTDIMTKPLVKFLFSALKIKESNWQLQNVISYLKTGFCNIDPDECDIFEDYASSWGIKGNKFFEEVWTMNPDGYASELTERGKHILASANSVKERLVMPLAKYFAKLDSSADVSEMCRATFEFLDEANVTENVRRSYLNNFEHGDKKAAAEDLSLYKTTLEILYSISSAIGSEKMSFSEFSSALSIVFSQSEIGTIPTAADEVLIGSASMLRLPDIKCAIIIGLNEGEFPQAVNEDGIFSDSDKEKLSELGIKLSSSSTSKASEELYYLYKSISSPKHSLVMTCSSFSSDGKAKRPSIAFERLKLLFPQIKVKTERDIPLSNRIWTKEIAAEYYPQTKDTELGISLKNILKDDSEKNIFFGGEDISVITEKCRISEENINKIFGNRISLTQSRLEKYVLCGFDYYCTYVLGLRESKKATFRLNDIGTFIHAILEKFMKEVTKDGSVDLSLSDKEIDEILERAVHSYLNELLGERFSVSNRTMHLFIRLKRLSSLIVRSIMTEFSDSDFYPAYFELPIGLKGDDGIPAMSFELNDGTRVSLRGIADRVDLYKKDGNVYIRVVDYKTGSKEFSLDDIKEGLNTQLLLYLFTICKTDKKHLGCDEGTDLLPAGIQYLSSNIPSLSLESVISDEEISYIAQQNLSRKGLLIDDETVLRAMSKSVDPDLLSGAKENKDGKIVGKSLLPPEKFDEIFDELSQVITEIALKMKSGYADAVPLKKGKEAPCNYCRMKQICRASQKNT